MTAINELKRIEAAGLDDIMTELFIAALAVSANLILPLVRKFWKYEVFPRELKKRMIVKTSKKDTHLKCDWTAISMLPSHHQEDVNLGSPYLT